MNTYDIIIVGAGAGGGVAAAVLAEAGLSVLVLERGSHLPPGSDGRDHLRHQRYSRYGHNAGPDIDSHPRVLVERDGRERVVRPHEPGYQNNAAAVGGGTTVYGAQAWRFLPDDFRMATVYGTPAGSSLADWPITYADLAPYYERIEWEMGVAGDGDLSVKHWQRERGFPMPPLPLTRRGSVLRGGAAALGWDVLPIPALINTVPYNGRPACTQCQFCVGFTCQVDAKSGTQNTFLPRAMATHRCTLISKAMVARVEVDGRGHVNGVTYVNDSGETIRARGRAVILAAGAIETARLLLNSATARYPQGLGNRHDQVGRHLQGHYYPAAVGLMSEVVYDGQGPGIATATVKFNHGNAGLVGGGMLADEFIDPPIVFWSRNLPPELPRWGEVNKRFMRENFTRIMRLTGPVQEIPSPDARVTVDPVVRDRWGQPVARLSGTTHPETVRTAAFMFERAKEWLRASGAVRVWGQPPGLYLSGGQHQAGTCRMGDDPRTSVTDHWGRVHGHKNLFVMDGSVHVTNGGFNPVLTILALAYRSAEHLAQTGV